MQIYASDVMVNAWIWLDLLQAKLGDSIALLDAYI